MSFWKVTIESIKAIDPIPNADAIEVATVRGWKCVVRKGDFKVGDEGVYMPLDTALPTDGDSRYTFLTSKGTKRIRTLKLRGQVSQGLFLPLSVLGDKLEVARYIDGDISHLLNVTHYEPPLPMGGETAGPFPAFVFKTDQERIQNIPDILTKYGDNVFEVTEKLDGCSGTYYRYEDDFGACSRNWSMKLDKASLWSGMFSKYNLSERLTTINRNMAIQAEVIGQGVEHNKYRRSTQEIFVYDIFDIDKQVNIGSIERMELCKRLGLTHVPLIEYKKLSDFATIDDLLKYAQGKSMLGDIDREGVVFKAMDGSFSFKVISNDWLLKNE